MDNDNQFEIKKSDLLIEGEIQYMLSTNSNLTFILTTDYLYIHEKNTNILNKYSFPSSLSQKNAKNISKNKNDESAYKIWSDSNNNHIIIKNSTGVFYFNYNYINVSNEKIKILNLINDSEYIVPFAVAFNDSNINTRDTDEILISDYDSNLYILRIKVDDKFNIVEKLTKIFSFKTKNNFCSNDEKLNELLDDDYFEMKSDDRILDMKMIITQSKGKSKIILIIAVSKRIIFQFVGKINSIKEIFKKDKTKEELLAHCKILPEIPNSNLKTTRLQITFSSENKKLFISWMSECGVCFGQFNKLSGFNPQREFNIYKYIKPTKNYSFLKYSCPIMTVQTSINIYFLYDSCLVVLNLLTNNITKVEHLNKKYIDMFYNSENKSLILYSHTEIIEIILNESSNLWKYYAELGDYNIALKYVNITNNEKVIQKLHKLYANDLFNKKDYNLAVEQYALSDENIEHVCLNLLIKKQLIPLIKYLKLYKKHHLPISNGSNGNEYFIQRYLINTWLIELTLETENCDIKKLIRENNIIESIRCVNKTYLMEILENEGNLKNLIDFALMKNDYKYVITNLMNYKKRTESLEYLKLFMSYSTDKDYCQNLINIFFNYSNIFINECPIITLELIEKNYSLIDQNKLLNLLININIYDPIKFKNIFEIILSFIRKMIKSVEKKNTNLDINIKKNLHNLYILYLSMQKDYEIEIITYLKRPFIKNNDIFIFPENKKSNEIFVDLDFAEKICKDKNLKACIPLILSLKKQYIQGITYALKNNEKNIALFIVNNIEDKILQKKIWLIIYKYYKSNDFAIKEILNKNNDVLKLEDVLPFFIDNIQLSDIKNYLESCIFKYDKKIDGFKNEIRDYNESIKEIIENKKYKMNNFNNFNLKDIVCAKCQKKLITKNFFLFPCGHAFDLSCILNILMYYNLRKIGDSYFKSKINKIKRLFKQIIDNEKNIENKKNISKIQGGIFTKILGNNKEIEEDDINTEESNLNVLRKDLMELINQECPLCGDGLIFSIQEKFGDEENNDWDI